MIDQLKQNNRAWAKGKLAVDPRFFKRLEGSAAARISVDRLLRQPVPANEIVGLTPGELFVHGNVANLAPPPHFDCSGFGSFVRLRSALRSVT